MIIFKLFKLLWVFFCIIFVVFLVDLWKTGGDEDVITQKQTTALLLQAEARMQTALYRNGGSGLYGPDIDRFVQWIHDGEEDFIRTSYPVFFRVACDGDDPAGDLANLIEIIKISFIDGKEQKIRDMEQALAQMRQ